MLQLIKFHLQSLKQTRITSSLMTVCLVVWLAQSDPGCGGRQRKQKAIIDNRLSPSVQFAAIVCDDCHKNSNIMRTLV